MIAAATNHWGGDVAIIVEPSHKNPGNLHVRALKAFELNEEQANALIDVLTQAADDHWGIE